MTQLDDFTREALCAGDQPPPGVEDRILAAIVGPLGGPGPDGGGGGGAPQAPPPGAATIGPTTLGFAAKIVAATVGLAAGGVALIAVAAAGVRSFGDSPPHTTASVEIAAGPEPASVAALGPNQDHSAPPDDVALEPEELPSPAAAPPRPRSSKLAAKPDSQAGIEAELALMKLAREAKEPDKALTVLEQHRKQFERGVFAAEREVLRVEQLCALGRIGEARSVAAAFVAKFPSNPLRSRVEPACKK